MSNNVNNITLQINLSPGDVNYAALTVPALIGHHANISKRLLVVDCCRPQKTKLIDPDLKFPWDVFNSNVEKITAIADGFLKDNVVTDVYYLKPADKLFKHLSKKYLAGVYDCTHGAGGTGNMSYWAGMELPDSDYVLHFDADMIMYQKPGYFWYNEAIGYLQENDDSVFAVPRLCPTLLTSADTPSLDEGRPINSFDNFWKNDWFSTRHFLLDKRKLAKFLPLVHGKLKAELLIRKYTNRAFPLDPEIVLFRSIGGRGGKRIILKNQDAWLLHPLNKPASYISILTQLIKSVANGETPDDQRGRENILTEAWVKYFESR